MEEKATNSLSNVGWPISWKIESRNLEGRMRHQPAVEILTITLNFPEVKNSSNITSNITSNKIHIAGLSPLNYL